MKTNAVGGEDQASAVPEKHVTPFWPTIWQLIRPYRLPMTGAVIAAFIVGLLITFQALVVKWIVDDGVLREHDGVLAPMAERLRYTVFFVALYLLFSISRILIWMAGYRPLVRSLEAIVCELRGRFFRHVQRLCFRFHDRVSSGELFNYIMGSPISSLRTFLQQFAMSVPYQLFSWLSMVVMLFTFNWVMALITLGTVGLVVYVNFNSRFVIRDMSADYMKTESEASRFVADMLQGTRAIKVYAIEENVTYSFETHVDRIREKSVALTLRQQVEGIKPEFVNYFGVGVVYLAGALFMIRGEMKPGTFMAFLTTFHGLMGPVMSMLQLNLIKANAEAGLDRIMRVLQAEQTTAELPPEAQVNVDQQAELAREVRMPCVLFKDVTFAYDENRKVFHNIDCRIEDGQTVALVGPSGSGKSTFVTLLLRLYDPQQGRILLNGADLKQYGLHDLRSAFGVVPQQPFIFQSTLMDNVRVARPDASDTEVREAMDTACVTEFLKDLPKGAHTFLGEGGFNLSGGQRQRIAIARAILIKPRYFIFDEATSALDNVSERHIQNAMAAMMKGHTSFIIAHRLSTVRNVDRILVFENGRIVQDGNYQTLSAQDGLFRRMLSEAQAPEPKVL